MNECVPSPCTNQRNLSFTSEVTLSNLNETNGSIESNKKTVNSLTDTLHVSNSCNVVKTFNSNEAESGNKNTNLDNVQNIEVSKIHLKSSNISLQISKKETSV